MRFTAQPEEKPQQPETQPEEKKPEKTPEMTPEEKERIKKENEERMKQDAEERQRKRDEARKSKEEEEKERMWDKIRVEEPAKAIRKATEDLSNGLNTKYNIPTQNKKKPIQVDVDGILYKANKGLRKSFVDIQGVLGSIMSDQDKVNFTMTVEFYDQAKSLKTELDKVMADKKGNRAGDVAARDAAGQMKTVIENIEMTFSSKYGLKDYRSLSHYEGPEDAALHAREYLKYTLDKYPSVYAGDPEKNIPASGDNKKFIGRHKVVSYRLEGMKEIAGEMVSIDLNYNKTGEAVIVQKVNAKAVDSFYHYMSELQKELYRIKNNGINESSQDILVAGTMLKEMSKLKAEILPKLPDKNLDSRWKPKPKDEKDKKPKKSGMLDLDQDLKHLLPEGMLPKLAYDDTQHDATGGSPSIGVGKLAGVPVKTPRLGAA